MHEAKQEKLKTASYSEPIQILTLIPDKWSQMYILFCSEYFKIFEYLVWTSHGIKKVGEVLAKSAPEKKESCHHWTLHLVKKVFEDDNFSRLVLEKKDCVNHHYSQKHFLNCNITGSPYVEMLLINIIKSLFLFFLSDCNVQCCFLSSLEALTAIWNITEHDPEILLQVSLK